MTEDLYTLVNHERGVRYEFARDGSKYAVTRVWLLDDEREYMGTYIRTDARAYWESLVHDGFVKA